MREHLDAPVLVGVGAAFDFHAGLVRQAPAWMRRRGSSGLPAGPRAASPVAALPALQPALRRRFRTPVHRRTAARATVRGYPAARGASIREDEGRAWRIVAALVALAVALGRAHRPAPTSTTTIPRRPHAVCGDIWVFARRTSDGAMLVRNLRRRRLERTGARWAVPSTSGPAAAAYGPDIEVFARGQDGAIWGDALSNGAWTGWSSLGGYVDVGAGGHRPARHDRISTWPIKGGDNTIYLDTYVPGSGWHGWGSLGGNLTSAPALDSHSDGILDVFARGTDGAVYQQAWNGSQWLRLGQPVRRHPRRARGGQQAAARPGRLRARRRQRDLPGPLGLGERLDRLGPARHARPSARPSPPSATAPRARSCSRAAATRCTPRSWTNPGGWTAWSDFGPIAVPPPPAPARRLPPQGEVNLLTGISCTPVGGLLHVSIKVQQAQGQGQAAASCGSRSSRAARTGPSGWTGMPRTRCGSGSTARPGPRAASTRASTSGARAHGALKHKLVFRRYTVCG